MSNVPPPFSSNYPRQQQQWGNYVRPPGVYFDTLQIAFEMLKNGLLQYVLGSLITLALAGLGYFALIACIFSIGGIQTRASSNPFLSSESFALNPLYQLTILLWTVLFYLGVMGLISMAVLHAQGQAASVSNFFKPFTRIRTVLPTILLVAVPYQLLSLLNAEVAQQMGAAPLDPVRVVIPSILLLLYILITGPVYLSVVASVFSGFSPFQCFIEAFRRIGWNSFLLSILILLASFVSGLGFIACCVGIIFTFPIFTNVIALHYLYYFPPTQPQRLG